MTQYSDIPDETTSCPNCGSAETMRIVYSRVTPDLLAAARRGEILLGGCLVLSTSPRRHCPRCEQSW